jgi:CheY-like chemotaxis protein
VAKGPGKLVSGRLSGLRVLVVDDNPPAREILEEPLSTLVQQVKAVASGSEAIAAVKAQDATEPFDVIFMDWRMWTGACPEWTGCRPAATSKATKRSATSRPSSW